MTRTEHVAWAKERALAEVDRGDNHTAIASMLSDMGKHPETENSVFVIGLIAPFHGTAEDTRRWIDGVN